MLKRRTSPTYTFLKPCDRFQQCFRFVCEKIEGSTPSDKKAKFLYRKNVCKNWIILTCCLLVILLFITLLFNIPFKAENIKFGQQPPTLQSKSLDGTCQSLTDACPVGLFAWFDTDIFNYDKVMVGYKDLLLNITSDALFVLFHTDVAKSFLWADNKNVQDIRQMFDNKNILSTSLSYTKCNEIINEFNLLKKDGIHITTKPLISKPTCGGKRTSTCLNSYAETHVGGGGIFHQIDFNHNVLDIVLNTSFSSTIRHGYYDFMVWTFVHEFLHLKFGVLGLQLNEQDRRIRTYAPLVVKDIACLYEWVYLRFDDNGSLACNHMLVDFAWEDSSATNVKVACYNNKRSGILTDKWTETMYDRIREKTQTFCFNEMRHFQYENSLPSPTDEFIPDKKDSRSNHPLCKDLLLLEALQFGCVKDGWTLENFTAAGFTIPTDGKSYT